MTLTPDDITLCIDPFSYHFERDYLFDPSSAQGIGEEINAPYLHLHRWFADRGIRVHTADRLLRREIGARLNIVMSFGLRDRYHALGRREDVVLSAFFAFESPVVDPGMYRALPEVTRHFKRVYSFSDPESLIPVIGQRLALRRFEIPYPIDGVRENLWQREDRKFLVMINHNRLPALYWNELYTARMRALEFFARTNEIDLYGRAWDGPSLLLGLPPWLPGTAHHLHRWLRRQWQRVHPNPLLVAARRVYHGFIPSKLTTLSEYTFCLCFENVVVNGWITEKLFDCLVVGTIPIFHGAPDVLDYVPAGCFIDMRQFAGYEDLRTFLKSLSPAAIAEYRANGKAFLESPAFRRFSKQTFTELLGRIVEEETGIRLLGGQAAAATAGASAR